MPIYEYHCPACQKKFDRFVRNISQQANTTCPVCHSRDVTRLMSAPVIHAGGTGSQGAAPEPSGDVSAAKPPVFGRKELQQAAEAKARLRDQISSGE